jgi:carbon-monoxide dehydrogenase medium subunit
MKPYALHQPESLTEALDLLAAHGDEDTHVIAGGTSMVLLMNMGLVQPEHVIALRKIPDLHGITSDPDGGLTIGALTTHRQLELSPQVHAYAPALRDTFRQVATVRIRNQATLGGNLVHADPAQDPPPMLIAFDASVTVRSQAGERTVPVEALFVGYLTTQLQPAEVLTAVHLPPLAPGTRATYLKFLPRTQDDYATVSVAAALRLDGDGRCEHARLALGGAAGVPLRARVVEEALVGEQLTDARIAEAAALVDGIVDPPSDARGSAAYKRRMARVWMERALRSLRDQPDQSSDRPSVQSNGRH